MADYTRTIYYGPTLRQFYAAYAMQGLLGGGGTFSDSLVRATFDIADSMIAYEEDENDELRDDGE